MPWGQRKAQTQFGVITGRVSDTNGALISRAKVTLTNTATNVKQETETNPEVYTFSPTSAPAITRSRSRIKASANPFGRSRSKWPNASLDFLMQVGGPVCGATLRGERAAQHVHRRSLAHRHREGDHPVAADHAQSL